MYAFSSFNALICERGMNPHSSWPDQGRQRRSTHLVVVKPTRSHIRLNSIALFTFWVFPVFGKGGGCARAENVSGSCIMHTHCDLSTFLSQRACSKVAQLLAKLVCMHAQWTSADWESRVGGYGASGLALLIHRPASHLPQPLLSTSLLIQGGFSALSHALIGWAMLGSISIWCERPFSPVSDLAIAAGHPGDAEISRHYAEGQARCQHPHLRHGQDERLTRVWPSHRASAPLPTPPRVLRHE